ncbi:hypothetical protein FACS1894133_2070 [Clostridia bacterium]|nr:hypothetical protein FACS1894133_2070 [Clostridia bacterium]
MKFVNVVMSLVTCAALAVTSGCDAIFGTQGDTAQSTGTSDAGGGDSAAQERNTPEITTQPSTHEPPEYIDPPTDVIDIPDLTEPFYPPQTTAPARTQTPTATTRPQITTPPTKPQTTTAPAATTAPPAQEQIWYTRTSGVMYRSGVDATHKDDLGYIVFDKPYPTGGYTYNQVKKGDKFGNLTVINTLYADNGFMRHAQVHLDGTVTLGGYIKQYKAKADYAEAGDLEFYPDAADYPLPIIAINKTVSPEVQNNPDNSDGFAFLTDTGVFRLGNINSLSPKGRELIPDDGSYTRVSVTITNVTLADGENGFYPCMGRITRIVAA